MPRTKKAVVAVPSEAEAREKLKDFAVASSKLKTIEGNLEQAIQKAREKFKDQIDDLTKQKQEAFDSLYAFADEHREDLFSKKKSIDWNFGVIGFRTGTPKVDKKKGITWEAALTILKAAGLKKFIRTKEEVDKEKIIASRDDEKIMNSLTPLGIFVDQTETFFVEPKEEELATV